MENFLDQALHPNFGLSPDQMTDICEMLITLMFLKKVTIEWWMAHLREVMTLVSKAQQIAAEARVFRAMSDDDPRRAGAEAAIELSLMEISKLRTSLLKTLQLLKEVPGPGVTKH